MLEFFEENSFIMPVFCFPWGGDPQGFLWTDIPALRWQHTLKTYFPKTLGCF